MPDAVPATMPDDRWTLVSTGPADGFEAGMARAVWLGEREIAVFNVDGEFHALAGRCLHRGGPLAEGLVRDGIVTCPLHWWRYDLRTGALVGAPSVRLARYRVNVIDGEVLVEVPPASPVESIRERLLRRAREWEQAQAAAMVQAGQTAPGDDG